MNKVYYVRNADSNKYEEVLGRELAYKFENGMVVAVKLHMGEEKGMFSPSLAKRTIKLLNNLGCKPFLFDTPVKYYGSRHTKQSYENTASKHGFTMTNMGCPVLISDDYVVVKTKHMNVEVSRDLAQADALLVLTHFKGHGCSGAGGAIKNLAMGCVSPRSKADQHSLGVPDVSQGCTGCGICETVCPAGAIKIREKAVIDVSACWGCTNCVYNCPSKVITITLTFDTLMAEAASAVLKALYNKPVYYVNDARMITKNCDCFKDPGKPIARDVGVLLGGDVVAVDKASIDLVNKQECRNVFKEVHHHDPYLQVREAERLGLGRQEYELSITD